MTARNPMAAFRKQIRDLHRRAYHILGLRVVSEIVTYIEKDLAEGFTPQLQAQAIRAWIQQMVSSSGGPDSENEGQQNLFVDWDTIFYPIKIDGKTGQIVLGDVDKSTVPAIRRVREANIEAATKSLAEFDTAWAVIEPILNANPGWKWRDACKWMEARASAAA